MSMKKTKNFFCELPEEVIMNVLSWLPVKSLLRFKCVSKQWLTLISSPFFKSLHLSHSLSNPARHTIFCHNTHYAAFTAFSPVTSSRDEKSIFELDRPTYCRTLRCIGSINGLVCILFSHKEIKIWNPSTRVIKEVPYRSKSSTPTSLGFGWDPTVDDYKVVRLSRRSVDLWSTNLQSWNTMEVDFNFHFERPACDVIVEGFNHWIVRGGTKLLVASFDMRREELRLVPVPHQLREMVIPCDRVVGMNWKGTLALVGRVAMDHKKYVYQLWTMDDSESWSRKLTFEFYSEYHYSFSPVNGLSLLVRTRGELIFYDVATREAKIVKYPYHCNTHTITPRAHYYVESLL